MINKKTIILTIIAVALLLIGFSLNYLSKLGLPVFRGDVYDQAALNAEITAEYLKYKNSIDKKYMDNIVYVTDKIKETRNKLLETPGLSYDELMRVDSYYNLSIATLYTARRLDDYNGVYPKIKKSLELLGENRVDDAIVLYVSMKPVLIRIYNDFDKALKILEETKTNYFPDKHLEKYKILYEELKKEVGFLREYMKLMDKLITNSNALRNSGGTATISLSSGLGRELMHEIDLSKFGELSGSVSNFLTNLASGGYSDTNYSNSANTNNNAGSMNNQQGSSSNYRGSGGLGGGPGGPSSDD